MKHKEVIFKNKKLSKSLSTLGLLAAGLSLASTPSFAGPFGIGILGVANLNNPSIEDGGSSVDVDGKFSFGGGLMTEFSFPVGVGIEVDFLYISRKFSYDSTEIFGQEVSSTFTNGSFHLPILARYRPIPFLNLGGGVYFDRAMSTWTVAAEGLGNETFDYSKNDFGFVLAVGTEIPLTSSKIVIDGRFVRSLSNSAQDEGDTFKYSSLQLLAGISFDI